MESVTKLFESFNEFLGIEKASDLLSNPIFIAICVAFLVYSLIKGWKIFSLGILAMLGGALIVVHLYPEDTSNLAELMKFFGAMGGMALVIIYFGFIRE
ncbi:hypothetical protein ACFL2Q_01030 [Thermodesulfobacteriota bacterium]